MNISTAKGAITALRTKSTLLAAYVSYAAGHDDKHRCAAKAYSANHEAADPNNPQGYYQKTGTTSVIVGTEMKSTWGKPPTAQPIYEQIKTLSDISEEEEKELLWSAIYKTPVSYYQSTDANKFLFSCGIPAGYAGFIFEGGGRAFPKQAEACAAMVLVIATGGSNIQLVTHFPASPAYFTRQVALT